MARIILLSLYIKKLIKLRLLINFISVIVLLLIFEFGFNPLWDYLYEIFDIKKTSFYGNEKTAFFLFSIIIIAPIVETLVFQVLIKYLLDFTSLRSIQNKIIYYSIISGVLFGLTHNYSIVHIIKATIMGVIFMLFYLKTLNKKKLMITIIYISTTHAFWNLFVWFCRNI
jgi:hypothetical protein